MTARPAASYTFGPFRIDGAARVLTRAGEIVALTPKAVETLVVLVEHAGQVVTREELIERVWPDAFVEPNNLAQNVSTLRRVLGDDADCRTYIETVPKRGYRFLAPVSVERPAAAAAAMTMAAPVPAHAPETRYARSGDVNIAYQVVGDGPFDLVFVMGWVSHLEYSGPSRPSRASCVAWRRSRGSSCSTSAARASPTG